MKQIMVILTILLLIATALFYKQVWAIFAGMSVLEAMNTIVTFILHVAVATIAAYAVMLVPEYVKPWLKVFRWKQRQVRRGRTPQVETAPARSPRMNKDQALAWMVSQMAAKNNPAPKRKTTGDNDEHNIRLDF